MVNHLTLQGRLVADPELRHTGSGAAVCNFRVAWSEKYKENETKLFLECVAWKPMAEIISGNFTKGKEIVVEGKLSTRSWRAKDETSRQSTELTVERVHFCGKKDQVTAAPEFEEMDGDDGDLPF